MRSATIAVTIVTLLLCALWRCSCEAESYCYYNCSGNGQCVDYTCRCNPGWHGESCRSQYSSLPVLSVGHLNLTSDSYKKLCRDKNTKHITLLIAVAALSCDRCATVEPAYQFLLQQAEELKLPLKLARVDGSAEPELVRALGAADYPSVVLVKSKCKRKYVYRGLLNGQALLGYVLKQTGKAVAQASTTAQADLEISQVVVRNQGLHTMVLAVAAFSGDSG